MTFDTWASAFTFRYEVPQEIPLILLRRVTSPEQRQRALAMILSEFIWRQDTAFMFAPFEPGDIESAWFLITLYRQSGLDRYEGSPWEVGLWEITDCWPLVCALLLLTASR